MPATFPVGVADALRADGVELTVDQGFFDDRRRAKSPRQLDGIRAAQGAAEAGMAAVAAALRRSEPGDGGRVLDGEPLTCERLKRLATDAFGEHGCRGDDLVVARGAQAANGHDTGSGRVGNDDVVLCDFFPRHVESACFGDMTRTFRVGAPDETITAWHRDCLEALELAIAMVRPGADGGELNRAVCAFFEGRGHPTTLSHPDGEPLRDGFFHALGHGVGLDLHEAPRDGPRRSDPRRGRRGRARAGPLSPGLGRRARRGRRRRHRRRLRGAEHVPPRPDALRVDLLRRYRIDGVLPVRPGGSR